MTSLSPCLIRVPALCLTIFVTACERSGESTYRGAPVPPLDLRTAAPCYDPDVGTDAIETLTRHRVALAECRRKHQNAVEAYEDVRENLGAEVEQ